MSNVPRALSSAGVRNDGTRCTVEADSIPIQNPRTLAYPLFQVRPTMREALATESIFSTPPISPILEMGAYEHLWMMPKASFKRIAEMFRSCPGSLPSDFIDRTDALDTADRVLEVLEKAEVGRFGIRIHGAAQYPERLRDAKDPVELLYYQGCWDLSEAPRIVSVVGTRKPTPEGVARTRRLVQELVANEFVITSGLATGIDTVAHTTAMKMGGNTIAVIGTPISDSYPRENADLQREIARNHLLISQIPVLRYRSQNFRMNRFFFPERNKTMSALSDATVIVEAGETSGTLIQAKAALEQGRKLFILDNCFRNPALSWPARFEERGAIRVRDIEDILERLL